MPRSAGVTTSAVVVIAGSGITILCGALMLLATGFISKSSPAANFPADVNIGAVLIGEAAIIGGLGGVRYRASLSEAMG